MFQLNRLMFCESESQLIVVLESVNDFRNVWLDD